MQNVLGQTPCRVIPDKQLQRKQWWVGERGSEYKGWGGKERNRVEQSIAGIVFVCCLTALEHDSASWRIMTISCDSFRLKMTKVKTTGF